MATDKPNLCSKNKSALSLVPRLTTRRYPHLLLSASACRRCRPIAGRRRRRPQLSIDIFCMAFSSKPAVRRSMRLTDGRRNTRGPIYKISYDLS